MGMSPVPPHGWMSYNKELPMNKGIVALCFAAFATLAFGPFGRKNELSLLPVASAQSNETTGRMACPEGSQLEEHLAPNATVAIVPGYSVSNHQARYVTRNGHVSVDICIVLRKFIEGEYAERQRVEIRGDSGVVYVYLQEKNLERVRR